MYLVLKKIGFSSFMPKYMVTEMLLPVCFSTMRIFIIFELTKTF